MREFAIFRLSSLFVIIFAIFVAKSVFSLPISVDERRQKSWEEDDIESDYDNDNSNENIFDGKSYFLENDVQREESNVVPAKLDFDETEFVKRWNHGAIMVDRVCGANYMEISVPLNVRRVGKKQTICSIMILSSCFVNGRHMRVNKTHMIFNFSYDEFAEDAISSDGKLKRDDGCSTDLRRYRYGSGTAYVFEVAMSIISPNSVLMSESLFAYCYFEKSKHSKSPAVQSSIQFFSSLYDRIPYSGTTKHLRFNEDIIFEIIDEDGPLSVENVPVNCWLSPRPIIEDSREDIEETMFIENGCPTRKGVVMDRKTTSRMGNDLGTRVRFYPGNSYHKEKAFLYVHCQFMKCSNYTKRIELRDGELPPCPWSHSCAYAQAMAYNESQLSIATSNTVIVTGKRKPKEIYLPAASSSDHAGPCDQQKYKDEMMEDSSMKVPLGLAILYCFLSFFMGIGLVTGIWCCERPGKAGTDIEADIEFRANGGKVLSCRKGAKSSH